MRFTTRDLLWLMVVVGLSLGWWNHYLRYTAEAVSWQQANMDNAIARTDAVMQAWAAKNALKTAEAKLKAAAKDSTKDSTQDTTPAPP